MRCCWLYGAQATPMFPSGPAWFEQSAIDLSALGGFTLQWLLGGCGLPYSCTIFARRAEAAWLLGSVVGASLVNHLDQVDDA